MNSSKSYLGIPFEGRVVVVAASVLIEAGCYYKLICCWDFNFSFTSFNTTVKSCRATLKG